MIISRCDENFLAEDDKMCIKFMGMNMDEDDMHDFENATDFVINGQGRGIWNGSNPPPRIHVCYILSLQWHVPYRVLIIITWVLKVSNKET